MKYTTTKNSDTSATMVVTLDAADLAQVHTQAITTLAKRVKVAGFRPGKTPANVAEKHLDPQLVQQEVIEAAVNRFYVKAVMEAKLQPLEQPKVEVKKIVPYTTLEFSATFDVVPEITVADYTKLNKTKAKISVKAAEITEVIDRLRSQLATKKEVKRAAKDGDEAIIDFKGTDAKGQDVQGATGTNYPLRLGSKSFIDGFEENLVGLKVDDTKDFTLTFPKDYGHAPLQNKKVTFAVTVKKVNEVTLPDVNDDFAKQVGPFETVEDLKKDIKEELTRQQEASARDQLKTEVMEEIIAKSKVPLPQVLVDDQARMVRQDMLQNLAYRGMTLKDYLESEKLTEEEWVKKEVAPAAERRVATGLLLSKIAEKEKVTTTNDEVAQRIAETKEQFQDPKMRAQLDTPEAQRDIASRLVTEKTLNRVLDLATTTK